VLETSIVPSEHFLTHSQCEWELLTVNPLDALGQVVLLVEFGRSQMDGLLLDGEADRVAVDREEFLALLEPLGGRGWRG